MTLPLEFFDISKAQAERPRWGDDRQCSLWVLAHEGVTGASWMSSFSLELM